MQEPWKKSGGWPYEGPRGKSWQLGYRDDEGRVRARSFKTKSDAEVWSKGYIRADRQGRLREFLLGPAQRPPKETPRLSRSWFSSGWRPMPTLIREAASRAARGTATDQSPHVTSSATR
jgi:hypothetical protein